MDVDKYKHNYKDFYENVTHLVYINKGRIIITKDAHVNPIRNSPLSSRSLLVNSFKWRSNNPKVMWIPLEANI